MQIVFSCCAVLFLGFACVVLQCGVIGWWSGAFGLRSWLVLFVVLLGFGGCGVVVWCYWVVVWSFWSLELNGLKRLLVPGVGWPLELLVDLWNWLVSGVVG